MQNIKGIVRFSRKHKTTLQRNNTPKGFHQRFQNHQITAMAFLSIETPLELCRFLQMTIYHIENQINYPQYIHYTINKKRGGKRHISAPNQQLKQIQKRLNYFLQAYYLWIKPKEVHGFVINPHYLGKRCNIVENAKAHVGKAHILNIDLKDFFPNISAWQVKNLFTSDYFGLNEQVATALALLTTYEAKLPTGAPTSPVLSNFICLQFDADLRQFCQENRLQFTRYADDLTFSSDTPISQDIIQRIKELIVENGFEVNEKKLRLTSSHSKQTVTGLIVNEKVNVDRALLKKTRAMVHDLSTNGVEMATRRHFNLRSIPSIKQEDYFLNRLVGYINFVGQVRGKDDVLYRKLLADFLPYDKQPAFHWER